MPTVRIVPRTERDTLGEGPLWSPRRNSLFWVDIPGQKIHSLRLSDELISSWTVPEPISWIVERSENPGFVVGLRSGFALLSLESFHIEPLGSPEPNRPQNRLNDASVDRFGRIWAGSMDMNASQATGALYRFDPDHTWSRIDDGYLVTNGPTFSLDHRILFHSDTGRRRIYAFDLEPDGTCVNRRVWLDFPEEWGYPDGMTTDAEGYIWIAHWGGARISRFSPDASLDRSISMPATNITSIAFAGDDLRRMFVTSAMTGREEEPAAGALFEVDSGIRGLPPLHFAG